MIHTDKLSCQLDVFSFKGAPSQVEHKTGFRIFTAIETALSERLGII
jgi:hypothetical protein